MKRIALSLVILLFSCHAASNDSLHIVGDFSAKPKNWLDASQQPQGIMIELLEEIARRTDIEFTYALYPWKRAFSLSQIGDGAIIGFSKTSERELIWDYSEPMFMDELVLVTTRSKAFDFRGLDSLDGRRLAIKSGASYGDDFEAARTEGHFTVLETTDRTGQMRMLAADRVDIVLVSPGRIALEAVLAKNQWLREHSDEFVVLSPPYKSDPNFLGIPKSMNKSHLLPEINNALSEIRRDGTYQKIIEDTLERVVGELRNTSEQ